MDIINNVASFGVSVRNFDWLWYHKFLGICIFRKVFSSSPDFFLDFFHNFRFKMVNNIYFFFL